MITCRIIRKGKSSRKIHRCRSNTNTELWTVFQGNVISMNTAGRNVDPALVDWKVLHRNTRTDIALGQVDQYSSYDVPNTQDLSSERVLLCPWTSSDLSSIALCLSTLRFRLLPSLILSWRCIGNSIEKLAATWHNFAYGFGNWRGNCLTLEQRYSHTLAYKSTSIRTFDDIWCKCFSVHCFYFLPVLL